jgi:hypothetical protein
MPRTPKDWSITLDVDANGNIDYGANQSKKVWHLDRLEWTSQYDFAVLFTNAYSPFKTNTPYQWATGGSSTGLKKIKKPAYKLEPYKYIAAVYYNGQILLEDPIIIVDDDSGGGGGDGGGGTRKRLAKK